MNRPDTGISRPARKRLFPVALDQGSSFQFNQTVLLTLLLDCAVCWEKCSGGPYQKLNQGRKRKVKKGGGHVKAC